MRPVVTERLLLRSFTESDLDDLHEIQRRPDVTRYLFFDARSWEETKTALDKRGGETELTTEGQNLAIAVELRETGRVIGDFNLEWVSAELGRAEIGFVMNPDHSGRGYATEAGREVLRLAFEHYGFHRVVGLCNGNNHSSQRLMERLGMRREAFFVQGEILKGERADVAVYAMLATEWEQGATAARSEGRAARG
ncbi:Protein N-acetyltransferase, RimJ/RimL family [Actinopolyspora alba]|uniref:Protein N-acetyltransferase, RimJ/RimL family n=1 Tax=Actinopolyspora alba TaxID=673379 RepID=A0A1I1X060_9ACTN|nr:GNAT family protein [Actinopolyspora alba]SFE00766.1 Protein N-acetyltransferase, RimJ/RimL family [Actinopolyspora alba]